MTTRIGVLLAVLLCAGCGNDVKGTYVGGNDSELLRPRQAGHVATVRRAHGRAAQHGGGNLTGVRMGVQVPNSKALRIAWRAYFVRGIVVSPLGFEPRT